MLSWTYAARASVWTVASAALLIAGLAVFELLLVSSLMLQSGSWGFSYRQWELSRFFFETLTVWLLLPHAIATCAAWLVLARLLPALDRSWSSICAGTPLAAALCFPLIASYSLRDRAAEFGFSYLAALLLMSCGTSGCMLLVRGLVRGLAPGAFGRR